MKRRFNLKAIAIALIVIGVSAGCVYLLHSFQKRRNAGAFLEHADRARDEKDLAKETKYLWAYLVLQPSDTDARVRFARLLYDQARTYRDRAGIFFRLEEAVRLKDKDTDLRRKVIDTALAIGRPEDASHHLKELLAQAGGKDAALEEELGQVAEVRLLWKEADEWYAKAIQDDPSHLSAYVRRANLWRRRLSKPTGEADDLIEEMVRANSKAYKAQLEWVRYHREYTGTERRDELRKVLAGLIEAHAADNPDVLLLAANIEADAGNLAQARTLLVRGQKLHPKELAFPRQLAALNLRGARPQDALDELRKIIDKVPPLGDDYWMTMELMLDAGEKEAAKQLVQKIHRDEATAALVAYLKARLAASNEQWGEASRLLDQASKDRLLPPGLAPRVHLWQARCQRQLGNPDGMLESAQASLKADPFWVPGQFARAEALTALGRVEDALAVYEPLAARFPAAQLAAVRLQVARNLRLPADRRDWNRPLKELDELPEGLRKEPEAIVLRAQVLLGHGQRPLAVHVLEEGVKAHPTQVLLWLSLADAVSGRGQNDQVTAVLARAEKALGDRVELRLARARLVRNDDPKASRELLERIERDADKLPVQEQVKWLRALGSFLVGASDLKAAERVYARLTVLRPEDLDAWGSLFDAVLRQGERARLLPIIESLRKVEGAEGVRWRHGQALLLAMSDTSGDTERARTYLREARKRRPSWAPPYALEGQLAEADGNSDEAIKLYRMALDRGASPVDLVGRLVRLLNRQGNYTEAQAELARFRDLVPTSGDLNRLEVLTTLRTGADREQALAAALRALPEDSRDFRNLLLRGQILLANGKRDQAEKAFRQAVTVGEKQPECHIALVSFLAEKDRASAEAALQDARKKLPAEVAPLTLASCYEVMGQRDKAEVEYQIAVKAKPDDPAVLRAVSSFYLRLGRLDSARPYFHKLIGMKGRQGEHHAAWARRGLALGMAITGDYQQSREALALLEENFKGKTPTAEDLRVRALILARRPGDRREAIRALETAFTRAQPMPDEEFFLATLLIANQDWTAGQQRLVRLLTSRHGNNPLYLVYYLQQLLTRNELETVDTWLARLEKVEPNSLRTVGTRARVLHVRKQDKEALALLRKYAATHAQNPGQQLGVARVLESLGFVEEAEPYYRGVARALGEKQPGATLALIGYLGRRNRITDALDLCEKVRGKVPDTALVEVWINVLRNGQPTEAQCRRVEGWLQEVRKKAPGQSLYELALANLSDLQGRTSEAAGIYQAILAKENRNLLAYNNLAVLLALREHKPEEGLAKVEKALQLAGPLPDLLDTRAIVYLSMGQNQKAIADLEEVVQMTPDPASYFRLADAYLRVKEDRKAQLAWQKARAGGFKLNDLHPLERDQARKALAVLEKTLE